MRFLYTFFIQLYGAGVKIAALGNNKAKQWLQGREHLFDQLAQTFSKPHAVIWLHSASAGEYEQAKPVLEALRQQYPQYKILVTFFSPSGYNVGKKSPLADYVFYLPLDTGDNAARFIQIVQPRLVLFVKYDFWYHHLKAVRDNKIPLLLFSSIFRPEQTFFKPHGRFYLSMLHLFTHIFVQDEASYGLLKKFGVTHCTIAGDTRFDRVSTIAQKSTPLPIIENFIAGSTVIVAGSTWPEDEEQLHAVLKKRGNIKLIIAPHEINEPHIKSIQQLFKNTIRYSQIKETERSFSAGVLIIDNIGMLSRLYRYAHITYIGGGFNKSGIHNTLEAAVWGRPVIFGPNYQKFREARELIKEGAAFSYTTEEELETTIDTLLSNEKAYANAGSAAGKYVQQNGGATAVIADYIQENRLLTSE